MMLARLLQSLAVGTLVGTIRIYQRWISPMLGPSCRFTPTCSQYAVLSLQKYGIVVGGYRTIRRILCCHPWHPGGHDPP